MSVRGEFRRILGEVVAVLREGEGAEGGDRVADALEPLRERAEVDLSAAAEETLAILPRVERAADDAPERLAAAAERLEAVCWVILGRA